MANPQVRQRITELERQEIYHRAYLERDRESKDAIDGLMKIFTEAIRQLKLPKEIDQQFRAAMLDALDKVVQSWNASQK